MTEYRMTVYDARDGWRWHLQAPNGRIVAESGEAYLRKSGAVLAARSVIVAVRHNSIEVKVREAVRPARSAD